MKTPLLPIQVPSIYKVNNQPVLLPKRMAFCTPDTYNAINAIGAHIRALKKGGDLVLSDLFRSYDMQFQAHIDWKTGKKTAYSPPPGGSMHEAGRAMDIDISALKITLAEFWTIAKEHGFLPIISKPDPGLKECWHFDCRGSHDKVYAYYANGKANNMPAYTAMATSAILAEGIKVDRFADKEREAFLQSGLIRLGFDPGPIDGNLGARSNAALEKAGITNTSIDSMVEQLENKLQAKFPNEVAATMTSHHDDDKPSHII